MGAGWGALKPREHLNSKEYLNKALGSIEYVTGDPIKEVFWDGEVCFWLYARHPGQDPLLYFSFLIVSFLKLNLFLLNFSRQWASFSTLGWSDSAEAEEGGTIPGDAAAGRRASGQAGEWCPCACSQLPAALPAYKGNKTAHPVLPSNQKTS